jgi:hypothetical protein
MLGMERLEISVAAAEAGSQFICDTWDHSAGIRNLTKMMIPN